MPDGKRMEEANCPEYGEGQHGPVACLDFAALDKKISKSARVMGEFVPFVVFLDVRLDNLDPSDRLG